VEYFPLRQQITLRGAAQVQQGQNTIRGSVMEYDLNTKSFKAQAGTDADERVTAVIYPESSGKKEPSAP
jgi:lipopolysaccharide transport protein LptA